MSINIGSNIRVQTTLPLDAKFIAADNTARYAILAGERYQGMIVFVTATSLTWQLQCGILNANWTALGSGGTGSVGTIYGTRAAPRSIVAATGIVSVSSHMGASDPDQTVFVKGSIAGESIISANPQIEAGTVVGSKMFLQGADDTDYITLNDGNGLDLGGPWSSNGGRNSLTLFWDGTTWSERGRKF